MSKQLTHQEQLFGIRDQELGTLETTNERLYPFIRAAHNLVDEAKIKPTSDGLRIQTVDRANVCMVDAELKLSSDTPSDTIGVNIKQLAGLLQNKPRDIRISLDCAIPNGVLYAEEESANGRVWNFRERVKFLDPDSILDERDVPELDLDVSIQVESDTLTKIVNRFPTGNPIEFRVKDGELSIGAVVSDRAESAGEYYALATTETEVSTEAVALYASEYLADILNGVSVINADSVQLSWSEEYPIRVEASGEYVSTTWFLAPRSHE